MPKLISSFFIASSVLVCGGCAGGIGQLEKPGDMRVGFFEGGLFTITTKLGDDKPAAASKETPAKPDFSTNQRFPAYTALQR